MECLLWGFRRELTTHNRTVININCKYIHDTHIVFTEAHHAEPKQHIHHLVCHYVHRYPFRFGASNCQQTKHPIKDVHRNLAKPPLKSNGSLIRQVNCGLRMHRDRLKRKPLVCEPDMHRGTYVTAICKEAYGLLGRKRPRTYRDACWDR